jgi:hypothetical protein
MLILKASIGLIEKKSRIDVLFEELKQMREITANWMISYNEKCPREALSNLPPIFSVNVKPSQTLL